jgi:hypothetical protein
VKRRAVVVVLAVLVAWVALGFGYHRLSEACHDARHALDNEPVTYADPVGAALDVAFWPVYLAADGINGRTCVPSQPAL